MDKAILNKLLSNVFYKDNASKLSTTLFHGEIQKIFTVISTYQSEHDDDLSIGELSLLYQSEHPTDTKAQRNLVNSIIEDIGEEDEISTSVATNILDGLWKRAAGEEIANIGIRISEGNYKLLDDLQNVVDKIVAVNNVDDNFVPATNDIDELLAISDAASRWTFNIKQLADRTPAIGAGQFGIIFATPETGKTAFAVSISAAPKGFCSQGAKVLYLGNEEIAERTVLRAVSSATGMTKDMIKASPDKAKALYKSTKDMLTFQSCHGWTFANFDEYLDRHNPDIVFLDMADKLSAGGKDMPRHEALEAIYIFLRQAAVRHNCAIYGMSQARDEAQGSMVLTPDMMAGSRVGKQAEGDWIVGIGKQNNSDPNVDNPLRSLYIGKNKLNGWHGQVLCNIQDTLSRYVD